MKKLRDGLSFDDRSARSHGITEKVISHSDFQKAENLLIYMHFGSEVKTDSIIASGLGMGKKVYVPKVSGKEMEFYEIRDLNECVPGFMNIPEPPEGAEQFIFKPEMKKKDTLMILPGLAFDINGGRMGYGGGFYDRYLEKCPDCIKLGISYDFQCVDEVPAEENDICMDMIITEKRVILKV